MEYMTDGGGVFYMNGVVIDDRQPIEKPHLMSERSTCLYCGEVTHFNYARMSGHKEKAAREKLVFLERNDVQHKKTCIVPDPAKL